mgnify:CR=1 FL=1
MAYASSAAPQSGLSRSMVKLLFFASCLLSIVSFYTTQQGMALYLNGWFSVLAALGVQLALVMVAWLIGISRGGKALLIAVYVITATVSIAFSYVSLYTWFSARERPATVERALYDRLGAVSTGAGRLLTGAIAEGRKHALALEEMAAAEREHGFISKAQDADPFLAGVREAVGREAQTYTGMVREGSGAGPRYTAFDRYAKMVRQSIAHMEASQRALADERSQSKPLDPTEKQLRAFHQVYDAIPWNDVEQTLHQGQFERPEVPAYSAFVDQSVSGQEDLMIAFSELFTAPTSRHIFSFTLAAFIDIIVFLLAYASGPYFFGSPEHRWFTAGAALDAVHDQAFLRDFLRKLEPGPRSLPRVDASRLSPGEVQFCLQLAAKNQATAAAEEGRSYFVLDTGLHESLLDALNTSGLPLRADTRRAPAGA